MPERELAREVTIMNANGLHTRPAGRFAAVARRFESEVQLRCGTRSADGKSIVSLLTLAAAHGRRVRVSACGPDAADALDTLCRLIENELGDEFEEA